MAVRAPPFKPPLFVYGTLSDPDLLAGVLGRPFAAEAVLPASAPGFAALTCPGRVYPGLVRIPGAAAEGLVLTDLTSFEHHKAAVLAAECAAATELRRGLVAVRPN